MQNQVIAEFIAQVLAHCVHLPQLLAIHQMCIPEAEIRPGQHVQPAPGKRRIVALRPAMYLIALRHAAPAAASGVQSAGNRIAAAEASWRS